MIHLKLRPKYDTPEMEEQEKVWLKEKSHLISRFHQGAEIGRDNLSKACMYETIGEMNLAYDLGIVERSDIEPIFEEIYGYLNDPKLKSGFTDEGYHTPYAYNNHIYSRLLYKLAVVFSILSLIIAEIRFYLQ